MSIGPKELAREVSWADGCHGAVTRDGETYACEKPAVAIVRGKWEGDEFHWPACAWHVNRYGPGVPLTEIAAALTVMAWAADRTGPTCDVDGCDDEPAVVVTSMTSGNRRFVCERCAEELTARDAWRSR